MKRSPLPPRTRPMARTTGLDRSTPLAKSNPDRQAKAAKRSAKKHRAYLASETRKVVEARSGGQCEFIITPDAWSATQFEPFRCVASATDHHHRTYARYGGDELPADIQHLCQGHHAYVESLKPAGNRRSRSFNQQRTYEQNLEVPRLRREHR